MRYNEYSSSSDRNAFANDLEKKMSETTAIQTVVETAETPETFATRFESPTVQKFLDATFHSPIDADLKKVFAIAAIIADKKGTLNFDLPKTAEQIAPVVSKALTTTKVNYKVGTLVMKPEKAIDTLVDHGVAVASRVVDKVVGKGLPIVVEKVGKVAEKVFPPVRFVMPFVKKTVEYVAPKVANVIKKGVKAIGEGVKKIAHKAVEGVKKVGRKIFNFLFG